MLKNKIKKEEIKKFNSDGFISTDELPAYGISEEEVIALKKELHATKKDLVIMVAGEPEMNMQVLNYLSNLITIFEPLEHVPFEAGIKYGTNSKLISIGVPIPISTMHWKA